MKCFVETDDNQRLKEFSTFESAKRYARKQSKMLNVACIAFGGGDQWERFYNRLGTAGSSERYNTRKENFKSP